MRSFAYFRTKEELLVMLPTTGFVKIIGGIVMARLTGRILEEKYAPGKRENSFYQEQRLGTKMVAVETERNEEWGILYYADKNTGSLKMKNTYLLG